MNARRFIIITLILTSILVAGCISDSESPSTTVPPEDTYNLTIEVDGDTTYDIGLSEITSLPYEHIDATMVKKTGAEYETSWGGTSIHGVFDYLGIENITELVFVALDGYEREVQYAQLQEAIFAWEDEAGNEISEEDGGPIRVIAPGLPANAWISNLYHIRATSAPLDTFYLSLVVDGQMAPLSIGISEIMAFDPVLLDAILEKSDGSQISTQWTGIYMSTLLESQDIGNLQTASFVASDGYTVTITGLALEDVFIAWADGDGNEISEEDGGPLRSIAPGEPAQKWMKYLSEIRVVPLPEDTTFLELDMGNGTMTLGLNELKMYPNDSYSVIMQKKDGSEVETFWTGTSLTALLEQYDVSSFTEVTFIASDGYSKTLSYEEAADTIIAWADGEGIDLTQEAGGPLYSVVPGQSASKWIKNLTSIQVAV